MPAPHTGGQGAGPDPKGPQAEPGHLSDPCCCPGKKQREVPQAVRAMRDTAGHHAGEALLTGSHSPPDAWGGLSSAVSGLQRDWGSGWGCRTTSCSRAVSHSQGLWGKTPNATRGLPWPSAACRRELWVSHCPAGEAESHCSGNYCPESCVATGFHTQEPVGTPGACH